MTEFENGLVEIAQLQNLLDDWQKFASDVTASDACGQEWLDSLRSRTKLALAQRA